MMDDRARARIAAVRDAIAANPFLRSPLATASRPPVDVIVPIHDAFDDTVDCLASVAVKTDAPFRLALINDGSRDPRVPALLAALDGAAPNVVVVDRPDNHGFVRTVNEGFRLGPASDVVILNSDTVVTPGWLARMTALAASRSDIATVTPLTNNGTICSVPSPLEDNALPEGYDVDRFAALIASVSLEIFPEVPTGVGFCMLITRRALDAVGDFDARAFGDGYGEENDFCQRAIEAGFVNLIADNAFVYHKGRGSFGPRGDDLLARNLATLAARHPRYHADVARVCAAHPLRPFHEYLGHALAARLESRQSVRARVLHMLHHGGGTEKHARDLAATDDPGVRNYVLVSHGHALDVDEYHAGRRLRSLRFPLRTAIGPYAPAPEAGYRDALATVCRTLEIDLVHVHHLMHHTLDIASVAAARGIPYVMTLHDYYTVCPSYTLLDPDGRPCGACLDPGHRGTPESCLKALGQPASYLHDYQQAMAAFLRGAARLFVPNIRVRDIVSARYPELRDTMTVIEHGHRPAPDGPRARRPIERDGRARLDVAVIGALDVHKGSSVLRDLLRANRRRETTFHLYGTAPDPDLTPAERDRGGRLDGSHFVYHGPYESTEIVRRLVADGIHVGLQLAVWPETFSYTVSEFVEAGIPVIAADLGAQGERIRRCRLGWTVADLREPGAVLAILDGILRDPAALDAMAIGMRRDEALIPIGTMWRRYGQAYEEIITRGGPSMTREAEPGADAAPSRRYLATLAMSVAEAESRETRLRQRAEEAEAQLQAVRQRLRSPRHRIADAIGDAVQRIPVVWPLLARLTEAVLRREERRGRPGA